MQFWTCRQLTWRRFGPGSRSLTPAFGIDSLSKTWLMDDLMDSLTKP